METDSQIEKLRSLLEPVARAEGYELVDVDIVGRAKSMIVRLTIDKEGGVNVEDCADFSRQAGLLLDAEDVIEESYTLEVSSPGLTRRLKKPSDYARAKGKLALFKIRKQVGKKNKILATIEDADENSATVVLKDTGERVVIEYKDIAKANLEIEF